MHIAGTGVQADGARDSLLKAAPCSGQHRSTMYLFGGGAASEGVTTTCSALSPLRVASLWVGESTHLRLPFSGDMTSALSVSAEAMIPASSGIVSWNSSCRL